MFASFAMKRSSREQEDDVIEEQLTSLRKSMAELPEDVRHALCSLIRQESDAAEPDSSAERPADSSSDLENKRQKRASATMLAATMPKSKSDAVEILKRFEKACAEAVEAVKFLQAADMYVQVGEPLHAWTWRCSENNERSKDLTEQVMDTANMVRHYLGIRDWHLGQRTSEGSVEPTAASNFASETLLNDSDASFEDADERFRRELDDMDAMQNDSEQKDVDDDASVGQPASSS